MNKEITGKGIQPYGLILIPMARYILRDRLLHLPKALL